MHFTAKRREIPGSLVTNPEGERSLAIVDGMGRSIRTAQLDATGAALNQATTTYDTIVNIAGFGDVVETSIADGLNQVMRSRSDGLTRTIQTVDELNKITSLTYDSNNNLLSSRDPNSVGLDCVFDARNRQVNCTDTQGDTTGKQFDHNNNLVVVTDAKTQDITCTFDARNRKIACLDRINGTTQWAYDENSNLLSLTDSEGKVTAYEYDPRNLQTKATYPDHVLGTNPGDPDYGITEVRYDGLQRLRVYTDQQGDYVTPVYDLASRMTERQYRDRTKLPTDPANDARST